ncbi:MAG: anti-sigma factor domain-containing protein [Acidimicrobiales bacterium]
MNSDLSARGPGGRELSHGEAAELLGAYALDALDEPERGWVEQHAQACGACRRELAADHEVASMLTPVWLAPPEGVWERIAASLEETPPALDLAPVIAMRPPPPPVGAAPAPGNYGLRVAAMVAVAAAVVIGMMGYKIVDDDRRLDRLAAGVHSQELERAAAAAAVDPEARTVRLSSEEGGLFADAVLLRDGSGYLLKDNLPALLPDRTYQLWGLLGDARISLGLLGPSPEGSAFKATGAVWGLAVTNEAAGGVVSSQGQPLVVGRLPDAS